MNPLTDTNGEHCTQRQVGNDWFLAGSISAEQVVRDCQIPAGKSLFIPLINNIYGAFLNDAPETRTEKFVRATGSCTEPARIVVKIVGFRVPKPTPFFNVQLPPGNYFGADETMIPEQVLSPSAEQGYYLFVRPLRPGKQYHTVDRIWMYAKWSQGHHVPSYGSWRRRGPLTR